MLCKEGLDDIYFRYRTANGRPVAYESILDGSWQAFIKRAIVFTSSAIISPTYEKIAQIAQHKLHSFMLILDMSDTLETQTSCLHVTKQVNSKNS